VTLISAHTFGCKTSPIMSTGKVILVTGGNRGLGYAMLQVAGARDASSTFIMTSRKLEAGQEAAAKLVEEGVMAKIEVIPLDVTNDDQILEAVKYVEEKHGKLDGEPPNRSSWILQNHCNSLTTQSWSTTPGSSASSKTKASPSFAESPTKCWTSTSLQSL
jgi:NADP-dependent 3-hydroxy acid dehydrogenase YdfG